MENKYSSKWQNYHFRLAIKKNGQLQAQVITDSEMKMEISVKLDKF